MRTIYEIAREISRIPPGDCYCVDEFDRIGLTGGGSIFKPRSVPEAIMENIVGSSYEFVFWEDPMTQKLVFRRLRTPIPESARLRTFVSADRRQHFTQRPDGLWDLNK